MKEIIQKWYDKLGFAPCMDGEFRESLQNIEIPETIEIQDYDLTCDDGKKNLFSYLFMCEALSDFYKAKGISEDILLDTLKDIVRWCNTWSEIKGELYLGELEWLSDHLSGQLFKIGRLQYIMDESKIECKELGIKKGDPILAIHIPQDGPLNIEKCKQSIADAETFFARYFPEFQYSYFSCHSWLLDDTLKDLLPHDSNIVKFGDLFINKIPFKSDDLLQYIFRWDTKREKIKDCKAETSLQVKIKDAVLNGKDFYDTYGFIRKTNCGC